MKYIVICDILPFSINGILIDRIPQGTIINGDVFSVKLIVALNKIGWLEMVEEGDGLWLEVKG